MHRTSPMLFLPAIILSVYASATLRAADDLSEFNLADKLINMGWNDLVEYRIQELRSADEPAAIIVEAKLNHRKAQQSASQNEKNTYLEKAQTLYDKYIGSYADRDAITAVQDARANIDLEQARAKVKLAEELESRNPDSEEASRLRGEAVDIFEKLVASFKKHADDTLTKHKDFLEKLRGFLDAGKKIPPDVMKAYPAIIQDVGQTQMSYCDKVLELIDAAPEGDERGTKYANELNAHAEKLDDMLSFFPAFTMYMTLVRGRATGMLGEDKYDKALELFQEVKDYNAPGEFERGLQHYAYFYAVKLGNHYKQYKKAVEQYEMWKFWDPAMAKRPEGMKMDIEAAESYFNLPPEADSTTDPDTAEAEHNQSVTKAFQLLVRVAGEEPKKSGGLCYVAQRKLAEYLLKVDKAISLPTKAYFDAAEGMFSLAKQAQRDMETARKIGDDALATSKQKRMDELFRMANKLYSEAISGTHREGAKLEERVRIEPIAWVNMGESYYQLGMLYESALCFKMCQDIFSVDKLDNMARLPADHDFAKLAAKPEDEISNMNEGARLEAMRIKKIVDKMKKEVERSQGNMRGALYLLSKKTKKPWDVLIYNSVLSQQEGAEGAESGGSAQYQNAKVLYDLANAFIEMAKNADGDERKKDFKEALTFYVNSITEFMKIKDDYMPHSLFMAARVNLKLMALYRDPQWDDVAIKFNEDGRSRSIRNKTKLIRKEAARRGELAETQLKSSIAAAETILKKPDYPTEKKQRLLVMVNQAKKQMVKVYVDTGRTIMGSGNSTANIDKAEAKFKEGFQYAIAVQRAWDIATPGDTDKLLSVIPSAWYNIYNARYFETRGLMKKTSLKPTKENLTALHEDLKLLTAIANNAIEEKMTILRAAGKISPEFLTPDMQLLTQVDFIKQKMVNALVSQKAIFDWDKTKKLGEILLHYTTNDRTLRDIQVRVDTWWKDLDESTRNDILAHFNSKIIFSETNINHQYRRFLRPMAAQMNALWVNYAILANTIAEKASGGDRNKQLELRNQFGYVEANANAGRFGYYRILNTATPTTGQLLATQRQNEIGGNGALELAIIRYILEKKDPQKKNRAISDVELQEIFYEMLAGRPRTGGERIIRLARYNGSDKDQLLVDALNMHAEMADYMLDDMQHYEWVNGKLTPANKLNRQLDDPNLKYDGQHRVDYGKALDMAAAIRAKFENKKINGKSILETLTTKRKGYKETYLQIVENEAQFRIDIQRIRDRYVELLILDLIRTGKKDVDIDVLKELCPSINRQIMDNPGTLKYQTQLINAYSIMGRQSEDKLKTLNTGVLPDDFFPPGRKTLDSRGKRYPIFIAMDMMKALYGKTDDVKQDEKRKKWLERPIMDTRPSLNVFRVEINRLNCLRYANLVTAQIRNSVGPGQIIYNEQNGNFRYPKKGEDVVLRDNEIDLKFWASRTLTRLYLKMAKLENDFNTKKTYLTNAKNFMRSVWVVAGGDLERIEKTWPHFRTPRVNPEKPSKTLPSDIDILIAMMKENNIPGSEELLKIKKIKSRNINYRPPDRYEQLFQTRNDQRKGIVKDENNYDHNAWSDDLQKEWEVLKKYSDLTKLLLDGPGAFESRTDLDETASRYIDVARKLNDPDALKKLSDAEKQKLQEDHDALFKKLNDERNALHKLIAEKYDIALIRLKQKQKQKAAEENK